MTTISYGPYGFSAQRTKQLSVVTTVFNEELLVEALVERIDAVLQAHAYDAEVIVVDDGSADGTLQLLHDLLPHYPRLRVVELYRNYGQVAALSAGMTLTRGEWVLMIDGDLQFDPAELPRFVEMVPRGYDLIGSVRVRRMETLRRKIVTFIANRINQYITGMPQIDFGSSFRLISWHILQQMADHNGQLHYNTPALFRNARKWMQLPVVQHKREKGSSKWNISKLMLHNLDLLASSHKAVILLLIISIIGGIGSLLLYLITTLNILPHARAASAPAMLLLASFTIGITGIVWYEVTRLRQAALGFPPYLIKAVYEG